MTATLIPVVRCDGRIGCGAETHRAMARTVGEVRRKGGWHERSGGRDIRPDCWAAGRC